MKKIINYRFKYWFLWLTIILGVMIIIVNQLNNSCNNVELVNNNPVLVCSENASLKPLVAITLSWVLFMILIVRFFKAKRSSSDHTITTDIVAALFAIVNLLTANFVNAYLVVLSLAVATTLANSIDQKANFTTSKSRINLSAVFSLIFLIISIASLYLSYNLNNNLPKSLVSALTVLPIAAILLPTISFIGGRSVALRYGIKTSSNSDLLQLARLKTFNVLGLGTIANQKPVVSYINHNDLLVEQAIISVISAINPFNKDLMSQAVSDYAQKNNIEQAPLTAIRQTDKGFFASIDDNRFVIGTEKFLRLNKINNMPNINNQNNIMVAMNGQYAGSVIFSDNLNPGADKFIKNLKKFKGNRINLFIKDESLVNISINSLDFNAIVSINDYNNNAKKDQKTKPVCFVISEEIPVALKNSQDLTVSFENNSAESDIALPNNNLNLLTLIYYIAKRSRLTAYSSLIVASSLSFIVQILSIFNYIDNGLALIIQYAVIVLTVFISLWSWKLPKRIIRMLDV